MNRWKNSPAFCLMMKHEGLNFLKLNASVRFSLLNELTVCLSAQLPERPVVPEPQQAGLPPHGHRLHRENARFKRCETLFKQRVSFSLGRLPSIQSLWEQRESLSTDYLHTPHLSLQNKSPAYKHRQSLWMFLFPDGPESVWTKCDWWLMNLLNVVCLL